MIRSFLALELSASLQARLRDKQQALRSICPGWRWVPPGNVHLTVRFLGDVSEERIEHQATSWREAVSGCRAGTVLLSGTGIFPDRGRPRVLWVGLGRQDPPGWLHELATVAEATARRIGFKPEHRPFRGHLTLARAARKGRPAPPPVAESEQPLGLLRVEEVVLFRSDLSPAGAQYTALQRFPLNGAG